MSLELVSSSKCFNGFQKVYKHLSEELGCSMKFSVYEPIVEEDVPLNVLVWLSGLTCTEQNFIQKSGFQRYASAKKILVVGPDTSPRDCNLPGDKDDWKFGEGAGCYLDAIQEPWNKHYKMYSYVSSELINVIRSKFKTAKFGILGHSMGGMGAIVIGLRNPELFMTVSALAPISNPTNTSWGKEIVFKRYLGAENKENWSLYDPSQVLKAYDGPPRQILVDQGANDEFLDSMLMPTSLKEAADGNPKVTVDLSVHDGYDHSYSFVSTFIGKHIEFHSKLLCESG